jgi:methyl-accepting chemotaxis protein
MKLTNLNVTARLAGGFGIVIVGALLLGATGWLGIERQSQVAHEVIDRDVQFTRAVASIRARVQMLRRFEKDMLLNAGNVDKVKEYKVKWDESRKRLDELVANARTSATSDAENKRIEQLATQLAKYSTNMEQVELAMVGGQIKTAEAGYRKVDEFRQIVRDTENVTQELFDGANKRIEGAKPVLEQIEHRVILVLGLVTALVLALAALIAFFIARSITVPVGYAVRVAEALAHGDLSQTVDVRSNDELGRLMLALRGTVQQLGGIVGRIKESSDKVNSAAREIAQANLDLSTRTEEQASALEETSASMQQMSATVGQNAQNARSANDLAAQASGVASKGGLAVREAVGTMNGITESSKRIADIIGVIDGIAFQTNILALNAAVEAARAGDQGRGFAVVASEVRSLAQRSAAAAKEIKTLITDSVAKVDAGSKQVNEAGRTMEEVVSSVRKVNELIAEITKASEEQAQGIGQVTEAMTQLEQVTQQNAAMVEEASAAAGSLEEQSRSMSGAVGAFRMQGQAPAAQVATVQHAPASRPRAVPTGKRPAAISKRAEQPMLVQGEPGWQQF